MPLKAYSCLLPNHKVSKLHLTHSIIAASFLEVFTLRRLVNKVIKCLWGCVMHISSSIHKFLETETSQPFATNCLHHTSMSLKIGKCLAVSSWKQSHPFNIWLWLVEALALACSSPCFSLAFKSFWVGPFQKISTAMFAFQYLITWFQNCP